MPGEGLARSGNARVRRGMIQLAWRLLMFQKNSALAQWFRARTENARGSRKTMIVALARKLLIALWRLVSFCVLHNEWRMLKLPRQFRSCPFACDGAPMMVRGGGIRHGPWLSCRLEEWVRRFGASLPMRMTASWFRSLDLPDTRLWRDLNRARRRAPPLIVIPTAPST